MKTRLDVSELYASNQVTVGIYLSASYHTRFLSKSLLPCRPSTLR